MFYHSFNQVEKAKAVDRYPGVENPLVIWQNRGGFRVFVEGKNPKEITAVEYCKKDQLGQEIIRLTNFSQGGTFSYPTQEQLRSAINSVTYNEYNRSDLTPEIGQLLRTGKEKLEKALRYLELSESTRY